MSDTKRLLLDFAPAILSSGKINSRWRSKFMLEGEALLAAFPEAESISEAVFLAQNERPVCQTCGGKVKFSAKTRTYARFCSTSCGQRDPSVRAKLEETNLTRHGARNPTAFGTTRHTQAIIDKYGSQEAKNKAVQEKVRSTCMEKYGVENVFAASTTKEKIVNTNLSRHGVKNSMQRPEVKARFRNADGSWKPAIENKEKRLKSKLATTTEKVRARLKADGFTLLTENIVGFKEEHLHLIRHDACGNTLQPQHLFYGRIPRCFTCAPKLAGTSFLQKQVEDFLSQHVEIEVGKRLLDGREIDILIPSHNIGIEVNGIYWHSELAGTDKFYHLEKTELAMQKGITLIHLFEDELVNKFELVQSMLLAKLGLHATRIGARKCVVRPITSKQAESFCLENHLQGATRCSEALGLFYGDEVLVACATFGKPRFTRNYDFELLRFCVLRRHNIPGGFSKLIRAFSKGKTGTLVSYANRCYSTGDVYLKNGFHLVETSKPSYWYFKNNDMKRYHRSLFQKRMLATKLDTFNPELTEWENMKNNGWNRFWDCGNLVFTLEL